MLFKLGRRFHVAESVEQTNGIYASRFGGVNFLNDLGELFFEIGAENVLSIVGYLFLCELEMKLLR